jgi:hypothetical protein
MCRLCNMGHGATIRCTEHGDACPSYFHVWCALAAMQRGESVRIRIEKGDIFALHCDMPASTSLALQAAVATRRGGGGDDAVQLLDGLEGLRSPLGGPGAWGRSPSLRVGGAAAAAAAGDDGVMVKGESMPVAMDARAFARSTSSRSAALFKSLAGSAAKSPAARKGRGGGSGRAAGMASPAAAAAPPSAVVVAGAANAAAASARGGGGGGGGGGGASGGGGGTAAGTAAAAAAAAAGTGAAGGQNDIG